MCQKFTPDELNKMDHQSKNDVICQMQERLDKLEHDYENLIEQIRLANQQKFGRSTEKLSEITGQLSFFNEPEAFCDETAEEPDIDDVIDESLKKPRKPKKKGQREEDLKDFPQEEVPHDVAGDTLDDTFGAGNWKSMPDEIFWQLRFEPAKWIAEKHIIKVYVGTDGMHQDEFLRGDHPKTLFKGSIEEYFAWVKETLENKTLLPKGKAADGLHYSVNQKSYLKLFLTDGEIPIDNSASERALRNFTLGRKNWMTINTVRGAQASAIIYSITETARANKLNVYYYIRHLLTELPKLLDESGNIEQSQLEPLMPWSKDLPVDCYSKRRD